MDCATTRCPVRLQTEADCVKAAEYDCIAKFIDAPWLDHPFVGDNFKRAWASSSEAARMTFVRLHQAELRAWSRVWEVSCASYARAMVAKALADHVWPTGVQRALGAALAAFDAEHAAYARTT